MSAAVFDLFNRAYALGAELLYALCLSLSRGPF